LVLDVEGNKDEEARPVTVHGNNGGVNQKWNVIYLDKAGKDETTGLNEEFGFDINRPFYIRSRMPMKRVMQCHGAGWIHLNTYKAKRLDQQFWFDEKTKTIHSQQWKNYAVEKYSNGGHPYLRATATVNSRWW